MTKTTITGPRHPLLRRIADEERTIRGRWRGLAGKIWQDARWRGLSMQSVYELTVTDGHVTYRYVGPVEEHGHLLNQAGYLDVRDNEYPPSLAVRLARYVDPDRYRGSIGRAVALRNAALTAAPSVAALLGICYQTGAIDWDTDESVAAAARRLCLDAGWNLLGGPNPVAPRPGDVWSTVVDRINIEPHPVGVYAAAYIDGRPQIAPALDEGGVRWGSAMLDDRSAAARCGVTWDTWRGYVSRGDTVSADERQPSRWRIATIDAWRHIRPRAPFPGW
jgi:hypothetical protein